jgi:hypothetical protein
MAATSHLTRRIRETQKNKQTEELLTRSPWPRTPSSGGGGERSVSAPIGLSRDSDRIWEGNRSPRWIARGTGVAFFEIGMDRVGSVVGSAFGGGGIDLNFAGAESGR